MTKSRLRSEHVLAPAWVLAAFTLCAATAHAQRGFFGGGQLGGSCYNDPVVKNIPYDGRFTFTRLIYSEGTGNCYYRGEPSWSHGYWEAFPERAEVNLLRIMEQVSIFHPHIPQTNAIAMDDPELFKFPVAYMTESGYWEITNRETMALRKYLLKGGFLIIDDSRDDFGRGKNGWVTLQADLKQVFPALHPIRLDNTYPIFHSFFDITKSLDDIPQAYDVRNIPEFYGVFQDNDPKKRMYMMINFNTDVSDYWEFTSQGFYPVESANDAYKLGVDYIMYALTH